MRIRDEWRQTGRNARVPRGIPWAIGLLVALLALSACTGETSATTDDDETDAATEAESEAEPTESAEGPVRGGTLRIGTTLNPTGFDPYFSRFPDSPVIENLHTRLINYEVDGTDLVATPDGLESWELEDDNTSAVMSLRPGQVFHSGNPVTSDDLLRLFERAMSEDGGQFQAVVAPISSAEVVDDLTVRLEFGEAINEATFTDILANFKLVEAARNSSEQLATEPAGSGPFRLVEFRPGSSVVLESFEDYYDADLPYLDRVEFTIFDSEDTMVSALQTGEVDVAWYVPARSAASLDGAGFLVEELPGPAVTQNMTLHPGRPPFDNKLVRQAMQRAIDRERIKSEVYFGYGTVLGLPLDTVSPIYGGDTSVPETSFDLDEAQRLLDEAGNPSGAVAITPPNPDTVLMLQIIQADLKSIGFDLEIEQLEIQTFVERLQKGADFEMIVGGQGSDLRNPANRQSRPFASTINNPLWGESVPQDYADAMADAQTAQSEAEFLDAAARIREALIEEAWYIGVITRPDIMVAREGVNNFTTYAGAAPRPFLVDTWLSPQDG